MAKLMLIGSACRVELHPPGEVEYTSEESYVATCETHPQWVGEYDTLDDVTEYAEDHADGKR